MAIKSLEQAEALKKELERYLSVGEQVKESECRVEIDRKKVKGIDYALVVVPTGGNAGQAFFYSAECVDFTRGHSLSMFMYVDEEGGYPLIKARIF